MGMGPLPEEQSRDRPARLRDVAALAGVDPSLVSRVLSGATGFSIRPETRMRVHRAAEELDYRPNHAARSLRTARSMAVGMVVPNLANVVYARIHAGAAERAAQVGYSLLVATGPTAPLARTLYGRIDGLMVASATSDAGPAGDDDAPTLPTVLVNRQEDGDVPSITVDDEEGADLATRHLLDLGHVRVAHLAGPQNADTARRRLHGYLRAMERAGAEVTGALVAGESYEEQGGFDAARELVTRDPAPTAIFVANIQAAIGALAALRELGIGVPEDVSVVALHDAPLARFLDPPLTTVRMPLEEMGRRAVTMLLDYLAGGDAQRIRVQTAPQLIERRSTARPRAT
jgi:LacI family transcriptional regulator